MSAVHWCNALLQLVLGRGEICRWSSNFSQTYAHANIPRLKSCVVLCPLPWPEFRIKKKKKNKTKTKPKIEALTVVLTIPCLGPGMPKLSEELDKRPFAT